MMRWPSPPPRFVNNLPQMKLVIRTDDGSNFVLLCDSANKQQEILNDLQGWPIDGNPRWYFIPGHLTDHGGGTHIARDKICKIFAGDDSQIDDCGNPRGN